MKSFKQLAMLIHLTILGILIKEITSVDYELTASGETMGTVLTNKPPDYSGPLTFYLRNANLTQIDPVNNFNLTLLSDGGRGSYKANCTNGRPAEIVCVVNDAIPGSLTIREMNVSSTTNNATNYIIKNGVINTANYSIAGNIIATNVTNRQKEGNGVAFQIGLENPLPYNINNQTFNANVSGVQKTGTCSGVKNDTALHCTINNVTDTDNITISSIPLGNNYQLVVPTTTLPGSNNPQQPGNAGNATNATNAGNVIGIPATGITKINRNKLDGAGIFGIVMAALAGLAGLGLCLMCFRNIPPVPAPVVSEAIQPIMVPEAVATQQPIVIDNAHAVVPSPMPQPLPTPILPPPRPVPIMPQPVVVPLVQPAQVQIIQPTPYAEQVVETPVVEPVVTDLVQPVQNIGIANEPYVNQGLGDFEQPIFTTGNQF